MNPQELANIVSGIVKDYVNKSLAPIFEKLHISEKTLLSALDKIENLEKITNDSEVKESLKSIVSEIESIKQVKPEKGEKGDTPEIDYEIIFKKIDEAVSSIPKPKDGRDADMDFVMGEIDKKISSIPKPQDGKSITVEDVKPMVFDYIEKQIEKIPHPQDGLDALDIEILPAINELKSYPRGVYASHLGGLWKSYKATEGMDGWECIVNGVTNVEIDYDGERKLLVKCIQSSGSKIEKTLSLPIVLDRGVYKQEQNYEKGDGVTFGGSFWIAQKEMPEGRPGSSDDWRLSVKRGRDGRESVKLESQIDKVKL